MILDFDHAAEYLGDLAKALHPGDEDAREAWLGAWCGRLKREGDAAVLASLRTPAVGCGAAREALAEVVRYFGNRVHRMDYPSYVARGWAIGSGPIEAAYKMVVGRRLKGAGCVGGPTGPMRSATCGPCSRAGTGSGTPTGPPHRTDSYLQR